MLSSIVSPRIPRALPLLCRAALACLVLSAGAEADRSVAERQHAAAEAEQWLMAVGATRTDTPGPVTNAVAMLAPHTKHTKPEDWPMAFYVGGPENAASLPRGAIVLSESIYDQLRAAPPISLTGTRDQAVAFILAHEMAHNLHGDIGWSPTGEYELDKVEKDRASAQEKQADQSAVRLLYDAGYGAKGLLGALAFACSTWVSQQGNGTDRYYWETLGAKTGGRLPDHGTARQRREWMLDALVQVLREHGQTDDDFLSALEHEDERMTAELRALVDDLRGANKGAKGDGPITGSPVVLRPEKSSRSKDMDLVFAIDSTSSMLDDIDAVKARVKELLTAFAERIRTTGGSMRTALVTYRDRDADAEWLRSYPFTSDPDATGAAVQGIVAQGGGDPPEDVYAALLRVINTEGLREKGEGKPAGWRDGVRKVIILMGDAPPKDRGSGGATLAKVAARAEEVDPVHIHTVATTSDPDTVRAFEAIADATGGTFRSIDRASELPEALIETIAEAGGVEKPASLSGAAGGASPARPSTGLPPGRPSMDWSWVALWVLVALLGMGIVALVAAILLRCPERLR